jgi:hypothetical protein
MDSAPCPLDMHLKTTASTVLNFIVFNIIVMEMKVEDKSKFFDALISLMQ